ncbi:hypothetical protein BaRGS_00015767 [Batillaria attramentaria]|uniref:Fibronectin type-III domain-containing protein n=1 Tax=Batillaria attramentaria TaxID=370345 RepID=A0ABD0L0W4_9CAEN
MINIPTAVFSLVVLLACGVSTVTCGKHCKYDKKGAKWTPCDPSLHVRTKTVPLRKGRDGCPPAKIITRPCKTGIVINNCLYVPVSSWSECDPTTKTATRTLELRKKDSDQCDYNEVESRDCDGKGSKRGKHDKKHKDKKHKHRKGKKGKEKGEKGLKTGKKGCRYKKGPWSDCDSATKQQVRTLELKKGPSTCKQEKVQERKCRHKKKGHKGKNNKGKKGRKGKNKKKGKKGKKDPDDTPVAPPKLTEMRVWPLASSVEVSWKPPDQGTVRGYQIGYGISIPDVYSVEVNASVLHYSIENLEPEQEYIVSLRARNKAGLGSPLYETVRTGRAEASGNSGQLLLAPVGVRAITVSAYSIVVSWADSSVLKLRGGVEDTTGKVYTVRYMQLNHLSKDDKPKFVMRNTTESLVYIEGLMPYTHYEFAVRVSQGSARSVWSMAVTNTTFASVPSSKPADFTADIVRSDPTTVTLTWQPPDEPNGPITGYVIFYSKDPILPDDAWAASAVNGNRLSTLIKDLDPNSAYFFKIQARNNVGFGPITSPVTVTVPDVLPSAPINFSSASVQHDPSAVMLKWQRPEKVLEPITGYVISYTDDPNLPERSWAIQAVAGDQLNNTITDLQPNAKYFFKLQAKNKAGFGPPTNPISYTIPDVPPSVPRALTVEKSRKYPCAVVISWLPPLDMGEPIIGYIVLYTEEDALQWAAEGIKGDHRSITLRKLKPHTTYQFKVQARSETHLGPSSPPVSYAPDDGLCDSNSSLKPPTDLRVIVLSSNSAIMSWRDPMRGIPYPDGKSDAASTYTVRYGPRDNPASHTYLNPPFPSLYLVDLNPNTEYEFSVRLNRENRHSSWSRRVYNTTMEAAPGTAPVNVTVTLAEDDPTVARITWGPPLMPNGRITGYLVFSTTRRKQPMSDWQVEGVHGNTTSLTVRDMMPNTKYVFKLQARNAKGYGPMSMAVTYKTPKVYGGTVEDVTVRTSSEDPYSAVISWQPPSNGRKRIAHYIVVRKDVEADETVRMQVPGDQLTVVSHGLLPARSYAFTVQTKFRHASGPHSAPVHYVVPKELLQ